MTCVYTKMSGNDDLVGYEIFSHHRWNFGCILQNWQL